MTKQTPLMAQAVALDRLEHPKVRDDARALLAQLDQLNKTLTKAPIKDRLGYMLEQSGCVDALNMELRLTIEQTEKTIAGIAKARTRRQDSEQDVRAQVSGVTATLINEQKALHDRATRLQMELSASESKRKASIETLAEAGLSQEQAEAMAKPSAESVQETREAIEAIPAELDALKNRLNSYASRVEILETNQ